MGEDKKSNRVVVWREVFTLNIRDLEIIIVSMKNETEDNNRCTMDGFYFLSVSENSNTDFLICTKSYCKKREF